MKINDNKLINRYSAPKFIKKNPEAKTKLEQWLWVIAGREDKIEMSKLDNPEVKKSNRISRRDNDRSKRKRNNWSKKNGKV